MEQLIGTEQYSGLDETDLHIIDALRKDGRVAFAQIAEQLGVSPGMIRQRYSRLIDQGFLKVVAITNPLRMGYKTMAMIGIRVDGSKLLNVAEKIALRVQPNARPENKTDPRGRCSAPVQLHALGLITDLQRIIPDPLIGLFADILPLPVQDQRNQRLRHAQVFGDPLL